MTGTVLSVAACVLLVAGALFFLVSAVAMLRTRDAVSRVNSMSPATGMGLPLILLGAFLIEVAESGWESGTFLKVAAAVGASLVVSSVASNMLGRAAYRAAEELDPFMVGDALDDGPPHSS